MNLTEALVSELIRIDIGTKSLISTLLNKMSEIEDLCLGDDLLHERCIEAIDSKNDSLIQDMIRELDVLSKGETK